MKHKMKTIPELWNEFEASLDQPLAPSKVESFAAAGDNVPVCNGGDFRCIARNCTPEFAGKVAAYLLNTFSDTPTNSARMRRAMMADLNKAAAQK